MYLTPEEQRMLDGAHGKSVQKSMQILVQLGTIYGAQKMLPVNSVHMPGSSIVVAGEGATSFVEEMADGIDHFAAFTTPCGLYHIKAAIAGVPLKEARKRTGYHTVQTHDSNMASAHPPPGPGGVL